MMIYVMSGVRGMFKVGISFNPARRGSAIANAGLRSIRLLYSRAVDPAKARDIEGHANFLLKDFKRNGEWFSAPLQKVKEAVDTSVEISGEGPKAKRTVGRKKEYPNRITLPLPDDMLAGIDASRFEGEDRVSMIREAIEREIKRRQKLAKLKAD